MMALRTFSYGGGVQSTAALVLAAQGKIDFPIFLFANTGDDSENPASLVYVREIALPYATAHGIALHELHRTRRDGTQETLTGRLMRQQRSIDIPMRLAPSGAPGNRKCTGDFKIVVVAKWQKQHGATVDAPAVCGIGISTNEAHRARSNSGIPYQTLAYPLLDLRLSKQDCINVIERAGLPIPGKSSCYYCPFHTKAYWARQQREEPELFAKAVELEHILTDRNKGLGRGGAYFTSALIPLDMAIVDVGQTEFDFEPFACAGGASCMT
jgi:hypothetical protein